MKRLSFFISCLLILSLSLTCLTVPSFASDSDGTGGEPTPIETGSNSGNEINAKGAILMEASEGKVLFEQNADQAFPPASVTKVMTLLLVSEAIECGKIKLTDPVQVSDYAASMGGSQVFLSPGETFTVEELIKCTVISSANDAAVALAEHVSGSEEQFVSEMNAKAEQMGLKATHFENVTGLDDSTVNHVTSARDIAIMSQKLIRYPFVMKYSGLWQDSIRNGAFTLTNTNRLVRFYRGATGLKTGSTSKAGFCLSATAERDGMTLIAVIVGAPSRDIRNAEAKRLLDFGFSSYGIYRFDGGENAGTSVKVKGGTVDAITVKVPSFSAVLKKREIASVKAEISLPDTVRAPLKAGEAIGKVVFSVGGKPFAEVPVTAGEAVSKIGLSELLVRLLHGILFI